MYVHHVDLATLDVGLVDVRHHVQRRAGRDQERGLLPDLQRADRERVDWLERYEQSLQPIEIGVREAVRLAVRRCATLWTGKKPLVEVTWLRVAG